MKVLFFILFTILLVCRGNGQFRNSNFNRKLNNEVVLVENFKCTNETTPCLCDKSCLKNKIIGNTTYCIIEKCWNLKDENCVSTGINFIAPLLLNIFPVTQFTGIGYASMERWDLFGIQLAITFGPIVLFCCCVCGNVLYDFRPKDTNVNELEESNYINIEKMSNVYTCCHGVLVITFWIISIVDTATPNKLKDGNGCYLSGFN
jgi:hypothetical protein